MPTYAYRCQETGETIDLVMSIDQMVSLGPNPMMISDSGTWAYKRLYTPPAGIIFKGSGWAGKP